MLNHPYKFLFINFFITFSLLIVGGLPFSFIAMFIISCVIFFSNYKEIGKKNTLVLIITYLLIFDSEYYSFSSFNFRLWYLIELPIFFFDIYEKFSITKKKYNIKYLVCFLILFLMLILYFLIDPLDGKLSIVKYFLFSIGLIYVLYNSYLDLLKKGKAFELLSFFFSLGLFVTFWGILQFLTYSNRSLNQKIMYDYYNLRPSGFFSETTWYSEYIFFSFVILFYFYLIFNKKKYLYSCIPCIIGIIISATRNTFLAIALWIFLSICFLLVNKKINKKVIIIYFSLLFITIFVITIIGIDNLKLIQKIIERFTNGDSGRTKALLKSIDLISESPIIGHGFSFNPKTDVAGNGTFIGAKSFNLFLMIIHTIGFEGFFLFILLIFFLYFNLVKIFLNHKFNNYLIRISIVFLTSFLSISMFAPMHQFPIGMYCIATCLAICKYYNINSKEII